jgi:Fe-S cluster assembly iron-binding protein IscA
MIVIRPAAIAQIKKSQPTDDTNLRLRIAAKVMPDGTIEHTMGFDTPNDADIKQAVSEGVEIIYFEEHENVLTGLTLDYSTLESGEDAFIFINPNSAGFVEPKEN